MTGKNSTQPTTPNTTLKLNQLNALISVSLTLDRAKNAQPADHQNHHKVQFTLQTTVVLVMGIPLYSQKFCTILDEIAFRKSFRDFSRRYTLTSLL